jgi:ferredoxin-type protein NapF
MTNGINRARRNLFRGAPASTPAPVRPPGALPENQFIDACTRCHNCIDKCPQDIIIKGSGGLPEIDFKLNECTFCNLCIDACDEPALSNSATPPWHLELTLADSCLAIKQVVCQSCQDVCDQRAISFPLHAGKVAVPEINQTDCNGCGACISICPSDSLKLQPRQDIPHEEAIASYA